ncbi:hypothetical protein SDJN03_09163, partial [Cucurbita argyrosperma subsp. sororia]
MQQQQQQQLLLGEASRRLGTGLKREIIEVFFVSLAEALAATGRYCKDSTSIHLHCAALPSPPHYSQLFPFAYLPVSCFSTRGGRDFVNYFLFMVSFLRVKS